MIKIVEVAGARPNYMKIAPIHKALLESGGFRPLFVHTGQHYDWEMSEVFLKDLGLPRPDHELEVGSGSHAEQTAQVMLRLEPILIEERPVVVMVVGDVNSTVGAALTAGKLNIPVAHVEAGLRSFDRTMPEEINRIVTDAISDVLFAPSSDAVENLAREGVPADRVHFVGNVMIDSLELLRPQANGSRVLSELGLIPKRFALCTLHRPSNVDADSSLGLVSEILERVSEHLAVALVAHPRTRKRLRETSLASRLEEAGVKIVLPVGYVDFLKLQMSATVVLSDSGGIQEETTILGTPCLTLREQTERPITVTEGTNEVVGLDPERIIAGVRRAMEGSSGSTTRRPELWDGRSAERIVSVLRHEFA